MASYVFKLGSICRTGGVHAVVNITGAATASVAVDVGQLEAQAVAVGAMSASERLTLALALHIWANNLTRPQLATEMNSAPGAQMTL